MSRLYAIVAQDCSHKECPPKIVTAELAPGLNVPLIVMNEKALTSLLRSAQDISTQTGLPLQLIEFEMKAVLQKIKPEKLEPVTSTYVENASQEIH